MKEKKRSDIELIQEIKHHRKLRTSIMQNLEKENRIIEALMTQLCEGELCGKK